MEELNNTQVTHTENDAEEFEVKEDRTFTQQEVNSIIKSRLHGMRASASKKAAAEYNAKLAELDAREKLFNAKVTLKENNLPEDFAEMLANSTDIDKTLELLKKHTTVQKEETKNSGFHPIGSNFSESGSVDFIAKAMGTDKYK